MEQQTQAAMPTPSNQSMHYAGFWIRLLAYIIDAIILGVIGYIIGMLFGNSESLMNIIAFVVGLAYMIGFWVSHAATPGKMALGLKIVTEDGSPLTVGKAIIRYIGYIVSSIALLLGFIWIGIDKKKQGWHDKMAHTYVIRK